MWIVHPHSDDSKYPFGFWLSDHTVNPTKYYPNSSSSSRDDYLWSRAEAELICDQLNIRDYGRVE